MRIAIYGKEFGSAFKPYIEQLFAFLGREKVDFCIYGPFFEHLTHVQGINPQSDSTFTHCSQLAGNTDLVVSVGGDGTFLEAVSFIKDTRVPLAGINSGRLGFLANISQNEILSAMQCILAGDYSFQERSLVCFETANNPFAAFNHALNEVTIHKNDTSSMITVHVHINGELLNSYWADGLLVSTPTGSTAYSLSVGGPVVDPGNSNLLISPIAPHNLTVRPIVLPDTCEIKLQVESRSGSFLVSLDSRYASFDVNTAITIRKSGFTIRTLRLPGHDFYRTLRTKLLWGLDARN